MVHSNLFGAIGNTPLVKLPLQNNTTILAKLEYLNPGGSIKDRPASYMIAQAEKDGRLKPGGTIVDASSGNQGIAVAMIGAAKRYKVIISVSEKISPEKLHTLRAYGAEVVICPATQFIDDPDSYHTVAKTIQAQTANSFMPNQYYNKENSDAHYYSTGPEIWQQTNGAITHFFAAAGTGGTISGVGKYLKERNPDIKIIAIDAANSWRSTNGNPKPYQLEGVGVDWNSPVLDYSVIDEILTVTDEQAITMLAELSAHFGLLVGPSSGAVAAIVKEYAQQHLKKSDCAVMIFGDSGRAYLSKNFYARSHTPASLELPIRTDQAGLL